MNPAQRHVEAQARRVQVAMLYMQGKYQSEIAQSLGITQQQISKDLKVLQQEWLAASLRDFDVAKAVELQKIDICERAYWQGWEKSCRDLEISLTKAVQGDKPRNEASIRKEGQAGDPRFLDGVLKCIERRCSILGLDTVSEAMKEAGTGLAALLDAARATPLLSRAAARHAPLPEA